MRSALPVSSVNVNVVYFYFLTAQLMSFKTLH